MDAATILQQRDAATIPHLEQYAPVWLLGEKLIPEDESVLFTVLFQHNLYGWVKRRYQYDGFADVLYYLGETAISEAEAFALQSQHEPYIQAGISDFMNAYGG
ncbi:MAG: hypothetical protein K8I30_10705 [Anaerolineae bacterium]|nr:hypothetical protein [Anaerolineae bacterium]